MAAGNTPTPDAGILYQIQDAPISKLATCTDFVACNDGVVSETGESCAAACDGKCCQGEDACIEFTGEVCRDDVSCVGDQACYGSSVNKVIQGCTGYRACVGVGYPYTEEINNSCLVNRLAFTPIQRR